MIAYRGARALGRQSAGEWVDLIRQCAFAQASVKTIGAVVIPLDGKQYLVESGELADVVKHSITLCYVLEAAGVRPRASKRRVVRGEGAEIQAWIDQQSLTQKEAAQHLNVGLDALKGMLRGDRSRYGDNTLKRVLKKMRKLIIGAT
jgi:predicted XRE-type DNA-binding protein